MSGGVDDRMDATRQNRSVVITGGSRGIGRAIVEHLLDGWSVVVLDLDPAADLGSHPHLAVVRGSASATDGVTDAVEAARALAPLRGWVNNAALFRDPDIMRDGADDFLIAVDANLRPVVRGTQAAIEEFRRRGASGSIVNVSSHQATRAVRGASAYATAKAAIEGFTRAMAVDHGQTGIRVNAIAPGSIETDRYRDHLASLDAAAAADAEALVASVHPLGRIGRAGEVAAAVEFLLSDASSFVTGAVLPVDGGRLAWGPDPEST